MSLSLCRLLLCLLFLVTLTGCFQVETLVRVNPDGSGSVEEQVLLSQPFLTRLQQLLQGFAPPDSPPPPLTLHDPEALRREARRMGEGVELIYSETLERDGFRGYRAIYSVADLNQLRLYPKQGPPLGPGANASPQQPFRFRFTAGAPARLSILPPADAAGTADVPNDPLPEPLDPGESAQLQELVRDLRLQLALEVAGQITASNASHRQGARVTLLDLDLSDASAEQLERLSRRPPDRFSAARSLLEKLPGARIDLHSQIDIAFQGGAPR